ncbi:NAD(P)/FAD-dependent oxidoreductase [Oceanicola sp. S124]|uniref:NAD(P)/FAD-dependent oxidoreductase n=1 Tax=Oceanicola sp. S124 TaxID=1042378 RepID=UPI0002559060|nr:FAD-binding oxidoreductase [Oceanicola sp. S124]
MSDSYDILIIGGGIAGLSLAAELAPHASVCLLEREPHLAYHASGRSAAMYIGDYGNDIVRALNHASEASHHAGGILSPKPMLMLGRAEDEGRFDVEAAGLGLSRVPLAEAQPFFPLLDPAVITRTAMRHDTYAMDTDLMVQNARRAALKGGVVIKTGAEVVALQHCGLWQVTAGDRTFTAKTLVNAAGAWTDEIASLAGVRPLGIQPYRRSMAVLPLPEGLDTSGWAFVDAAGERWYAKAQAGKLLVSPSEADPMPPMDAWADDMVLAEGLARFEEMVTLEVTRLEHSWAGLRSFAPDHALVIGRAPSHPDFLWLAGQGGYGFQTAPAAARLAADLLLGRTPELPAEVVSALSPARFG